MAKYNPHPTIKTRDLDSDTIRELLDVLESSAGRSFVEVEEMARAIEMARAYFTNAHFRVVATDSYGNPESVCCCLCDKVGMINEKRNGFYIPHRPDCELVLVSENCTAAIEALRRSSGE